MSTVYDSYINGRNDHCRRCCRSGVAHHIRAAGAAGTPAKPTPSAPGVGNTETAADPPAGATRASVRGGCCGHECAQSRG